MAEHQTTNSGDRDSRRREWGKCRGWGQRQEVTRTGSPSLTHIPLEVRAIRGSTADLPSACGVQSGEASVVEEESGGVKAVIPKQ